MKTKLTEAVVARFTCPPGKPQAHLWDNVQAGLGVRALPAYTDGNGARQPGKRTWVVHGRVKNAEGGTGVERRITLGDVATVTLEDARELARVARAQMGAGVDPVAAKAAAAAAAKAAAMTLRQVADHYIARKTTRNGPLKANTIRDINEVVDKAFKAWAHRPVAGITWAMCEQRHDELARGGLNGDRPAPTTARGAFVVLRALINWAMDKRLAPIADNPVRALKGQMAAPKVRTTKVPMDRIGHVWAALRAVRADPAQYDATHTQADALSFMLLTGGRESEVLGLTWDRVHLEEDAGSWHLPTPKNGNPVTLPLSAPARALLASRPRRRGCPYVFPARSGKGHAGPPRGPAMQAAIAAAGCHLDRHALRRTFTTLAITVLDMPLWKAELLTNHMRAGNVTLDVYTERNDLRYLAPEAERIGAYMTAPAGNVVKLPRRRA